MSDATAPSQATWIAVGSLSIVAGLALGYVVSLPPKSAHMIAHEMVANGHARRGRRVRRMR